MISFVSALKKLWNCKTLYLSTKYAYSFLLILFFYNLVVFKADATPVTAALIGDTVELSCEINEEKCGSIYFITWSKNYSTNSEWTRVYVYSDDFKKPLETLENPSRAVMILNSTAATLRISPVRVEDDGFYKCDIVYLGVECPSFHYVNLLTLVEPSRPLVSVNDVQVQDKSLVGPLVEGSEQSFTCESFMGKPYPNVSWSKNGASLLSKQTWKVEPTLQVNASNTFSMTVSREDIDAELQCIVDLNYTNTKYTFSIRLDINVAPLWVELRNMYDQETYVEGDEVSFLCRANGAKPPAKITWFNGTEKMRIQPSSNVSAIPSDGTYVTDSTLTFEASRYDHQSTFMCEATNSVLKQKKREPLFKSVYIEVQYTPTVEVAPVNGVKVNETDAIILFCNYEANPSEKSGIRWFVNGNPIENISVDFERGDDLSPPYLKIPQAQRENEGYYTCSIQNKIGWGNSTNQPYVTVFYAPDVIARVSPRIVSENGETSVSLSCLVAAANPEKLLFIRWYKNGVIMNQTTERDIVWVGIDRTATGNYSCQAQNAAGWGPVSEPQELIVMYPPGEAFLSSYPALPLKGESISFTCLVSDLGSPSAKLYEWRKDGRVVTQTTDGNITIDFMTLSDEGNYSCAAVNAAGVGQSSYFFVDAYAPPYFLESLSKTFGVGKVSENISLTCTVECDPHCEVSWLKDGEDLSNSKMYIIKTSNQEKNAERNFFESVVTTLYWNLNEWPGGTLDESLDKSNFSCISTPNIVGPNISSTTMFRIEYAPTSVDIYPEIKNIAEGDFPNDVLYCDSSAFPDPDYLWKFGDQVVSIERILVMNYNVTRDKAGTYTCIATNRHGNASSSATIDVHYNPECNIEVSDADEDGRVNLTCTAVANPLHTIDFVWLRDNETIQSESFYDEKGEFYFSRLRVLQNDPEYYGRYECISNNSIGPSTPCSFKITGAAPVIKSDSNDDSITIFIIIVVIVILIMIITIICCIICRRKNKNPDKMGKREGPIGGAEPTPPKPSDRTKYPPTGEPVYQNVADQSTPKVKPMPRTKNKPLYENVPPPATTPSEGPYRPEDDDLVYADMYDDIKMGKVPDPRIKPQLPPKKSKSDERELAPEIQRPAPTPNNI